MFWRPLSIVSSAGARTHRTRPCRHAQFCVIVRGDWLATIHQAWTANPSDGRVVGRLETFITASWRRTIGPEHPYTLRTINNRADSLAKLGRYAEAERMQRDVFDIKRRVLGPDQPFTAVSGYNLACLASRQGRKNEALSLLRQAVDHGLPVYGDLGIDNDPDLKSLHGDPRFDSLVADAKERAAGPQKPH